MAACLEEAKVHGSDGIVQSLNALAFKEEEGAFCICSGGSSKFHQGSMKLSPSTCPP